MGEYQGTVTHGTTVEALVQVSYPLPSDLVLFVFVTRSTVYCSRKTMDCMVRSCRPNVLVVYTVGLGLLRIPLRYN